MSRRKLTENVVTAAQLRRGDVVILRCGAAVNVATCQRRREGVLLRIEGATRPRMLPLDAPVIVLA